MIFIFSRRIKRKYLSLISSLLLLLYLFFVGWDNIPAKRAVIMQMYLIGGWLGGQKANILYGISLAALFLCVENIYVYRSLSFQLSFIATIGIIVLKDSIINFLTRISKNEFINDVIAINFAAGISTMPLIWLYFNKISLISLIVNLIIAPLIPLVFLLGLIFIFLLLFQIKFIFINYGLFWILNLIVELIDWSGSLSSAVIDLKANPLIFLFVFFIFLFLIFWTFYNKYKDV
jgi:competence protein ComEC